MKYSERPGVPEGKIKNATQKASAKQEAPRLYEPRFIIKRSQ